MGESIVVEMTRGKKEPDLSKVPSGKTVALMMMDTGWRVALPIIILSMIGHNLDLKWQTGPRYLLIGFFLSLVMAITLVYRQLVRLFPEEFGKNRVKEPKLSKKGSKK